MLNPHAFADNDSDYADDEYSERASFTEYGENRKSSAGSLDPRQYHVTYANVEHGECKILKNMYSRWFIVR